MPHCEFLVVERNNQNRSQYHWHCSHELKSLYPANGGYFGQPFLAESLPVVAFDTRRPALVSVLLRIAAVVGHRLHSTAGFVDLARRYDRTNRTPAISSCLGRDNHVQRSA